MKINKFWNFQWK